MMFVGMRQQKESRVIFDGSSLDTEVECILPETD